MLSLKEGVDPEQDFERFSSFIQGCHVGRVFDREGLVVATMSNLRLDGSLDGQDYRLAVYEYAFNETQVRNHPAVVAMYVMLFYGCQRWRPGVRNFLCFAGYPKTVLVYSKRLPDLKLDGDPGLDPFERHLIDIYADKVLGDRFDPERRVVWMPTIPPSLSERWLSRNGDEPLVLSYFERSPEWCAGEGLIAISHLDGGLRLVREFGSRIIQRAGLRSAETNRRLRLKLQHWSRFK